MTVMIPLAVPAAVAALGLGFARPHPLVKAHDRDGSVHSLPSPEVKLALFHFWATWCRPCRRELPRLARFAASESFERLKKDGAGLYVLAVDAPETKLAPYLERYGVIAQDWTMKTTVQRARRIARTDALPVTVVYDARRRAVVARWVGEQDWNAPQRLRQLRTWIGGPAP